MKFASSTIHLTGTSLVLACGLVAALADNKGQFNVILERNPFGLKEPVQPPPPPPPPEPPKTVKLSGIVSIIGPPRAMLVRQEPGQTKPDYLTLREGDKDGAVEVVRIDAAAGEVEIINGGVKKVLTFKDDGLKPPTGPAPAMAGMQGGAQPLGAQINAAGGSQAVQTWSGRGASTAVPGATYPPGVAPNLSAPAPTGGTTGPSLQPDLRPTPTRQIRVPIQPQGNAVPPTPPQIDPAKQELMMRGMEVYHKDAIAKGDFPPFPTSTPLPTP